MILMMGQGIVAPVLPLYAQSFGVGTATIGLAITSFGAARLLMNMPAGYISERYGRRRLLIAGAATAALGSLAAGLADSFAWLVASLFVAGTGAAAYGTGAIILLAEITEAENRGRVMSVFQGSTLLGAAVGPAVGGLVAEAFGLGAPFFLLATLSALGAVLTFARMPAARDETVDDPAISGDATDQSPLRTARSLLKSRDFLLVSMLTVAIFVTRTGGRLTLLPLVGENRLGMSAGALGLVFAMMMVLNLVALLPAGAIVDRFGRKAVIVPSALLTGVALILFAVCNDVWAFVLAGVFLGLGTGILGPAPAAYAADLAPPRQHGITMSIYRTFSDGGLVAGPLLLGGLAQLSGLGTALAFDAVLIVLVALLFGALARETLRRTATPHPHDVV